MKAKSKNATAKKTYRNKSALLIGNGINRSSSISKDVYNWEKLLVDLSNDFSDNKIVNNEKKKPFPMFYDAIVNFAVENNANSESDVKRSINEKLNNLKSSPKYDFLRTIKCDEILTTNYDYLIEQFLTTNWIRGYVTKFETFYSLSRFQESGKKVWHIHGEQGDIRSMLLGFRLYINYAAKIRQRASLFLSTIRNIDKKEVIKYESWVDMFFTHNITIVGLGMEFTEYTLWWLLAYRHFTKISNREIIVDNKIKFIAPSFTIDEKPYLKEMLEAYDVKVKDIPINKKGDYDSFYEELKTINWDE